MKNYYLSMLVLASVLASAPVLAHTECTASTLHDSEDGVLYRANGGEVVMKYLKIGQIVIFNEQKYKLVKWEVSGGPEEGLQIESLSDGSKRSLSCTDENTPTDD